MTEVKNKRKFIIATILITYFIVFLCYNFYADGFYKSNSSTYGLSMFYTINSFSNFLPFYIYLGFLATNFIPSQYYKNKYSKFQKFIITRVTNKVRTKYEIKKVLIYSFIFRILLHILVFFIINTFFVEINFSFYKDPSYYPDGFFALSSNCFLSFILFIIYSSIGFSVFSLFIYSLIYYIRNFYVYKVSGIIMSIIGVFLPAFLGNLYLSISNNYNSLGIGLLYLIYSGNLLSPGIDTLIYRPSILTTNIYFFVSCLGYLLISLILILIRYRKERKYD